MAVQQAVLFPVQTTTGTAKTQLNTSDPGQVFSFKGTDFLSPNTVLSNVDVFSGGGAAGDNIFGKNPNSTNILSNTEKTFNAIVTNSFGVTNLANLVGNTTGTTPGTTTATTTTTTPGTVVFSQVHTPSPQLLSDLANYNPLMWLNPSGTNVTLGTMDSFNKIMGGNGIFTPTLNNSPLYPFLAPLQPSFSDVNISTLGGQVNSLPQALIFPNTSQSGANLWNTTLVPTAIIPGTTTTTTTTPTGTTSQTIQPIAAIFGFFELLLASVTNRA